LKAKVLSLRTQDVIKTEKEIMGARALGRVIVGKVEQRLKRLAFERLIRNNMIGFTHHKITLTVLKLKGANLMLRALGMKNEVKGAF